MILGISTQPRDHQSARLTPYFCIEYIHIMFLREFEAKRLLRDIGIAVPAGRLIDDPPDIANADVPYPLAVKAQVASGGRGKAGGIVRADDAAQATAVASAILGKTFSGEVPRSVLLEPWIEMERELYLSLTLDGQAGGFSLLYAPTGGVDVESGTDLVRYPFGTPECFRGHLLRELLVEHEPAPRVREGVIALARRLLNLAVKQDCLTIEINPLALRPDGQLVAADAKIMLDESAAFRSGEITARIAADRLDQPEITRRCLDARLMLVELEGDVGLVSGGAGMTMAAMDMISDFGGTPACFLDCSANPTPEGYRLAFELLDANPAVRVIIVSIFGGATQMDRVARVMREIMEERSADAKPIVFRLNGTHVDGIPEVFEPAGLYNHPTLEDAVSAAVSITRETAP